MTIQNATTTAILIACLIFLAGCQQALKGAFVDGAEIDKQLVNYALPENGATVHVSEDNPTHPASTLTNGIIDSVHWETGEGWEVRFDGAYAYGKYAAAGENAWFAQRSLERSNRLGMFRGEQINPRERVDPTEFEDEDYKSRGTSVYGFGGNTSSAMAWVVVELPEEELITRVIVHTVDSEKYPARNYGVRDFGVQFWTPQAGGWQNVERFNKKVGDQHDSIRNNKKGRVPVRFKPVRTSKIRLLVRWTNDAKNYKKTYYNRYVQGTVRLTEIEIYGLEKRDEIAAAPALAAAEDEQTLDQILTAKPAASDATEEKWVEVFPANPPPTPQAAPTAAFDPDAEIQAVIAAYQSAYSNRDLQGILATISPTYSRGRENYSQFKKKMQSLFETYAQLDLQLQRVRIETDPPTATVASDYSIELTSAGASTTSVSGKLFFKLTQTSDGWQIVRIDTQK
jgi:ketosteroid isomerase-like protein